jgi:hypothetical protein
MYQIATKLPNGPKNVPNCKNGQRVYQIFPFQGPRKFTHIAIFVLKMYHLATLPEPASPDDWGKNHHRQSKIKKMEL